MKAEIDDTTAFGCSHHNHSKHRVSVCGLTFDEASVLEGKINDLLDGKSEREIRNLEKSQRSEDAYMGSAINDILFEFQTSKSGLAISRAEAGNKLHNLYKNPPEGFIMKELEEVRGTINPKEKKYTFTVKFDPGNVIDRIEFTKFKKGEVCERNYIHIKWDELDEKQSAKPGEGDQGREDTEKWLKDTGPMPKMEDGQSLSKPIRFEDNNKIHYGQDMGRHEGLPSNVDFYPREEEDGQIRLIGDGYGILKEHNLPGSYGNGAIYVKKEDVLSATIAELRNHKRSKESVDFKGGQAAFENWSTDRFTPADILGSIIYLCKKAQEAEGRKVELTDEEIAKIFSK